MSITLLAFAHARDRFGFSSRTVECTPADTPRAIMQRVAPDAALDSLAVAVDCEFRGWDTPIGEAREMALIPPVSGG